MGNFQPQNYGADFVNAMTATAGMLNDRRRLDMEERKIAAEDETRRLRNEGLELENSSKKQAMENEKSLQTYLQLSGRMNAGTLEPEDWKKMTKATGDVMQAVPYLPSDPKDIPRYKQALSEVLTGIDQVRTLPPGDYIYSRADNIPEVNATLDSFRTLLGKNRLGNEFRDNDGSVTGRPGSVYRTNDVGGFSVVSGEGNRAAFTPLFSITDVNGLPIKDQAGKQVLVPATAGQSNGNDDVVRMLTPEEVLTKAGFAFDLLNNAEKLGIGSEEGRRKYINSALLPFLGAEGAREAWRNQNELDRVKGLSVQEKTEVADAWHEVNTALEGKNLRSKADIVNIISKVGASGKATPNALKLVEQSLLARLPEKKEQWGRVISGKYAGNDDYEELYTYDDESQQARPTGQIRYTGKKSTTDSQLASSRRSGSGTRSPKLPTEVYTAEWMVQNGLATDLNEAWNKIRTSRSNPESMFKNVYSALAEENAARDPGATDYKSPEELTHQAWEIANSLSSNWPRATGRRNISQLRKYFDSVRMFETNSSALESAVRQGWTKDDILEAAKGTGVENSARAYFSRQSSAAAAVPSTKSPGIVHPTSSTKTQKDGSYATATVRDGRITVNFSDVPQPRRAVSAPATSRQESFASTLQAAHVPNSVGSTSKRVSQPARAVAKDTASQSLSGLGEDELSAALSLASKNVREAKERLSVASARKQGVAEAVKKLQEAERYYNQLNQVASEKFRKGMKNLFVERFAPRNNGRPFNPVTGTMY